jgi:cyanophycin synthetase
MYLRSTGNLSTGGTAIDVTDVVHPDNREMACGPPRRDRPRRRRHRLPHPRHLPSYREIGGAICEVNAAPGFRMHVAPSEGRPRDVAGPVMDMLFPPGTPSRIPIAAVTGTNGKTTDARMLAHIHKLPARPSASPPPTASTSTAAHRRRRHDRPCQRAHGPPRPLGRRRRARDRPRRPPARGMGYRACNVGAVLNVQSDHLGLGGIDTLEQLAEVKRIVVEVARDCGGAQRRRRTLPAHGRLHAKRSTCATSP